LDPVVTTLKGHWNIFITPEIPGNLMWNHKNPSTSPDESVREIPELPAPAATQRTELPAAAAAHVRGDSTGYATAQITIPFQNLNPDSDNSDSRFPF